MPSIPSPFLDPGTHSATNALGILQLKRDHLIPTILSPSPTADYAEGKVENTRFGSYPHSTLIDQQWGSQILASVVDTGSRSSKKKGKKQKQGQAESKKRKRENGDVEVKNEDVQSPAVREAATATSGFAHLVPPTPETWTLCLPHRTQVVYTPDYSYILQKLRARPGDHIIEAGAGSGSFTHAAVRAVFNRYPEESEVPHGEAPADSDTFIYKRKTPKRMGGVYSFEYHEPRANQLRQEIEEHGLSPAVTVTHRDVYRDGFCLSDSSPNADIIFLDLPAPWLALKHLARSPPSAAVIKSVSDGTSDPSTPADATSTTPAQPFRSPLNPNNTVRICTFSPCIEQVTKTVSAMRELGWLEITMSEIQAKRLEVRRERIGLHEEGLRNANPSPATVAEAVQRLRDVEGRAKVFHGLQKEKQVEIMRTAEARKRGEKTEDVKLEDMSEDKERRIAGLPPSKHDRLKKAKEGLETRELWKEGRLVHRTEPELKTHTSYLVFAVLPREWGSANEEKVRRKWNKD